MIELADARERLGVRRAPACQQGFQRFGKLVEAVAHPRYLRRARGRSAHLDHLVFLEFCQVGGFGFDRLGYLVGSGEASLAETVLAGCRQSAGRDHRLSGGFTQCIEPLLGVLGADFHFRLRSWFWFN